LRAAGAAPPAARKTGMHSTFKVMKRGVKRIHPSHFRDFLGELFLTKSNITFTNLSLGEVGMKLYLREPERGYLDLDFAISRVTDANALP
jgi:hypothetical protein